MAGYATFLLSTVFKVDAAIGFTVRLCHRKAALVHHNGSTGSIIPSNSSIGTLLNRYCDGTESENTLDQSAPSQGRMALVYPKRLSARQMI